MVYAFSFCLVSHNCIVQYFSVWFPKTLEIFHQGHLRGWAFSVHFNVYPKFLGFSRLLLRISYIGETFLIFVLCGKDNFSSYFSKVGFRNSLASFLFHWAATCGTSKRHLLIENFAGRFTI